MPYWIQNIVAISVLLSDTIQIYYILRTMLDWFKAEIVCSQTFVTSRDIMNDISAFAFILWG